MNKAHLILLLTLFAVNVHAWTPDTIRYCDCVSRVYEEGKCDFDNLMYVSPCDSLYKLKGTQFGELHFTLTILDTGKINFGLIEKGNLFYYIDFKVKSVYDSNGVIDNELYIHDHFHYYPPPPLFATVRGTVMSVILRCNENNVEIKIEDCTVTLDDTIKGGMFEAFFDEYQGFNLWEYYPWGNDESTARISQLEVLNDPLNIDDMFSGWIVAGLTANQDLYRAGRVFDLAGSPVVKLDGNGVYFIVDRKSKAIRLITRVRN